MKTKTILYKVYTRKGEYHHAYSAELKGSREWAIDCARTVDGYVTQVSDDLRKNRKENLYSWGRSLMLTLIKSILKSLELFLSSKKQIILF